MPFKRKWRVSVTSNGLAPGERLKRNVPLNNNSSYWGWVGTEVTQASDITHEHLLATCGLSRRNNNPFCQNKYDPSLDRASQPKLAHIQRKLKAEGELNDDVIIVSDDEELVCSPRNCKSNPNCLNYLGQEHWEDEDDVIKAFVESAPLGENPFSRNRESNAPVGLKNLGATCYANASLQVWFRDLAFRRGVYKCTSSDVSMSAHKDSPIFQLQVTFAALQSGTQNSFNPIKLVESLRLRTGEQQDAQEFSKLFISHLDAEFRKQSDPEVKTLVIDQFQGKHVYGTICHQCQHRSEKLSNFLEIEVSLKNNSKLEERIEAALQPEILSGDNQYLCSSCESFQDATRYIELEELPPVLHISLLRFVYDLSTMERKKSKHSLSFPMTLDMNPFMRRKHSGNSELLNEGKNIYELRGVLLHKGASAYHGHYEAQAYDETHKSWFQFNDERVTKVKFLGETSRSDPVIIDDDSDGSFQRRKTQGYIKRRRIDSDDDVEKPNRIKSVSSRDAYMLIYARRHTQSSSHYSRLQDDPLPPSDALEVIEALNISHDEACRSYEEKKETLKVLFQERRKKIMGIYRKWNPDPSATDCILVSSQALSAWLSQHRDRHFCAVLQPENHEKAKPFPLDDITCVHLAVDPSKAGSIKRISRRACSEILKDTGWELKPTFGVSDVCKECVKRSFQERLYKMEHPRLVARFGLISEATVDSTGFWISKPWIKDWRLTKPKMHVISEGDPAPDSDGFLSDVLCEHGDLSLNTTSRRRICPGAAKLLQSIYPNWHPPPYDAELCPICDANIRISRENKRELRKQAEEEKAKLKRLYEEFQLSDAPISVDGPLALIPYHFVKTWKRWLDRPTECLRPELVDNTPFICKHNMLLLDPDDAADLEGFAVIVERRDWDNLESIYPSGPLVTVQKEVRDDMSSTFTLELAVCEDCRLKRKTDWTTTEIVIRFNSVLKEAKASQQTNLDTYLNSGTRQSKRLRQIKEVERRRRLAVSKTTTVKEIKEMVQEEFNIPTIYQRLFYNNAELENNSATVELLNIYPNSVLDLKQESEVVEVDSDHETTEEPYKERGFGGTLLSTSGSQTPNSPRSKEKPCSACTYSNDADALACTICDTSFI